MTAEKKAIDLVSKHGGDKAAALVTIAEILRIAKKLKNEYLQLYYEQVKSEVEK